MRLVGGRRLNLQIVDRSGCSDGLVLVLDLDRNGASPLGTCDARQEAIGQLPPIHQASMISSYMYTATRQGTMGLPTPTSLFTICTTTPASRKPHNESGTCGCCSRNSVRKELKFEINLKSIEGLASRRSCTSGKGAPPATIRPTPSREKPPGQCTGAMTKCCPEI